MVRLYSYTAVFTNFDLLLHRQTLHHRQTQVEDDVQGQQSQTSHLNIARYRKAVTSALWLQLTLVACYLPFSILWPLSLGRLSSDVYLAITELYID